MNSYVCTVANGGSFKITPDTTGSRRLEKFVLSTDLRESP